MQGKWTTQIWQDVLNLSTQKHREGQKKQILGGRLGDLFWSRLYFTCQNFPWWLSGKESACQFKRHGFNPWVGKIPWNRKWQPSPVSFLGNPMDRGAWWAAIHGVTKSQIQLSHWKTSTYYVPIRKPKDIEICKHLYTHTHTHTHICNVICYKNNFLNLPSKTQNQDIIVIFDFFLLDNHSPIASQVFSILPP